MHRIGTANLRASCTQTARVSSSALVLSRCSALVLPRFESSHEGSVPIATDLLSVSSPKATLRHFSRCPSCISRKSKIAQSKCTYSFQDVLIDAFVAKRFQSRPIERRLARPGTTAHEDNIQWVSSIYDRWSLGRLMSAGFPG